MFLKVKEIGWRQLLQSSVHRNLLQATSPKRKYVKLKHHFITYRVLYCVASQKVNYTIIGLILTLESA